MVATMSALMINAVGLRGARKIRHLELREAQMAGKTHANVNVAGLGTEIVPSESLHMGAPEKHYSRIRKMHKSHSAAVER